MSNDCIFCKLKNEERIIGECEQTITFIDIDRMYDYHCL
jgi:diadenosine tetraphosphate (Ap4A) HIT family hydrolase